MKSSLLVCVLLGTLTVAGEVQRPKYGVTVTVDEGFNFAGLKTYVWTNSHPSSDKALDRRITAAVDRELAALGLTKRASEPGDVLVTYASLIRTDVDLKAEPDDNGALRQYPVGILVVAFLEPSSHYQVLRLRMDSPIDTEPAKLQEAIDAGVAALFAEYPTRQPH